MSKQKLLSMIAGFGLILLVQQGFAAEAPPAGSPQLSQILVNLQSKGYTDIRKIEFEDGVYKVDMVSKLGKETDLKLSPENGEILSTKTGSTHRNPHLLAVSPLEAAKKVEAAGYHSIYKIELKEDEYEIEALDAKNDKAELTINGKNGKVSKKWL
jgi:uncharacterized membrane protein YkoI